MKPVNVEFLIKSKEWMEDKKMIRIEFRGKKYYIDWEAYKKQLQWQKEREAALSRYFKSIIDMLYGNRPS